MGVILNIYPKDVGDSFGESGSSSGIIGAIVAIPIAGCIKILIDEFATEDNDEKPKAKLATATVTSDSEKPSAQAN